MNSLSDYGMIDKLYEASRAGVKIKLIIRGINCLIPEVLGMSDNIESISIVDKFLEHPRLYIFENDNIVGEIIYQKDQYIFGHITFRKLSKELSIDMSFNLENHHLELNKQDWLVL